MFSKEALKSAVTKTTQERLDNFMELQAYRAIENATVVFAKVHEKGQGLEGLNLNAVLPYARFMFEYFLRCAKRDVKDFYRENGITYTVEYVNVEYTTRTGKDGSVTVAILFTNPGKSDNVVEEQRGFANKDQTEYSCVHVEQLDEFNCARLLIPTVAMAEVADVIVG